MFDSRKVRIGTCSAYRYLYNKDGCPNLSTLIWFVFLYLTAIV